jgi:hypothetical protein
MKRRSLVLNTLPLLYEHVKKKVIFNYINIFIFLFILIFISRAYVVPFFVFDPFYF